jgi:predicted nucleic acid-binding protein
VEALVDTNVLVYRFDSRFPAKQAIATETLRRGIAEDTVYVPHQAVVEFIAAVTRADKNGESILSPQEAWREADEILYQFEILYPNEEVLRTAITPTSGPTPRCFLYRSCFRRISQTVAGMGRFAS